MSVMITMIIRMRGDVVVLVVRRNRKDIELIEERVS